MPEAKLGVFQGSYPTTPEYIGYHAIRQPGSVAVIDQGKSFSFEAFDRDIRKMIGVLQGFGLKPGQMTAIEFLPLKTTFTSFYCHWITLLAFEAYGVATVSFTNDEVSCLEDIADVLDLIMVFSDKKKFESNRVFVMDEKWFMQAMAEEPAPTLPQVAFGPDTPCRIIKSSGTTGKMKHMIRTFENQDSIFRNVQFTRGYNQQSRFFAFMGFNISAFHTAAVTCIRAGGFCVYDTDKKLADTLTKHEITHVSLLPLSLMRMLDNLPEDYAKPPNLRILTIGAPVSEAVRKRVLHSLASQLAETYGTNEASTISTMNAEGVGVIWPGVQVETVDDDDQPVIGVPGWVRIKSMSCVRGYINNPEATDKMFRDGWFYPGDLVILKEPRLLKLIGRADDLLNIQGIKCAPQELEEKLSNELPIHDVCVTAIPDSEGANHLAVVLVPHNPDEIDEISLRLEILVPGVYGTIRLIVASEIPRTGSGKIQRTKVKEMLRTVKL